MPTAQSTDSPSTRESQHLMRPARYGPGETTRTSPRAPSGKCFKFPVTSHAPEACAKARIGASLGFGHASGHSSGSASFKLTSITKSNQSGGNPFRANFDLRTTSEYPATTLGLVTNCTCPSRTQSIGVAAGAPSELIPAETSTLVSSTTSLIPDSLQNQPSVPQQFPLRSPHRSAHQPPGQSATPASGSPWPSPAAAPGLPESRRPSQVRESRQTHSAPPAASSRPPEPPPEPSFPVS